MAQFCSKTQYWCSKTINKYLWPQMARMEMNYVLKPLGQHFQVLWLFYKNR